MFGLDPAGDTHDLSSLQKMLPVSASRHRQGPISSSNFSLVGIVHHRAVSWSYSIGGAKVGINVLVSDDMHLSRFALTALLEQDEEIRVIGSVDTSLDRLLEYAKSYLPDVVIISFEGEGADAVAVAEKLATLLGCRSLLLATAFPRSIVRQAFEGMVNGMLQRSVPPRRLFEAVHRLHQGERVFDTELTVAALGTRGCPLSQRELSVLERLARGDTAAEIAAGLHLSVGTVRNYLSSIVTKLEARSRIDAIRIARDSHWI